MRTIRRSFLPLDLKREIAEAGIDGVVSVQARQALSETEDLLGWAQEHEFIRGVVGWVPLVSDSVREDIERFADRDELKGVRHVLQSEPDDHYMLRDDFNRGVALLKDFGLVYDILIFERHLPQTLQFVDRHPNQVFVLDHIAKPRIKEGLLAPWQSNLYTTRTTAQRLLQSLRHGDRGGLGFLDGKSAHPVLRHSVFRIRAETSDVRLGLAHVPAGDPIWTLVPARREIRCPSQRYRTGAFLGRDGR